MGIKKILNDREAFKQAKDDDSLFSVTDEQRRHIQMIALETYKDILCVCKEIDAVPFLVGGSALGAVRHHGFIPWDDDLDIGLLRKQYERFLDAFTQRFSDKYTINAAGRSLNAKSRFTKIMRKGTICRSLIAPADNSLNGVFVDVFPIDNVPNNHVRRNIKGILCNIIEFVSSQVYYIEFADEKGIELLRRTGKLSYYTRKLLGIIFGIRKASQWFALLNKVEQWEDENSNYCSIVPGRKHYFGEIFERKIVFPPQYVPFCDIEAPVFHDVDRYLKNMYGDYMVIPPIEKREAHWVVELDFGSVINEEIKNNG